MYTEYVVWRATEDDMVKYATYRTFEEAKSCADVLRRNQFGTIYVELILHEKVYEPKNRPPRS